MSRVRGLYRAGSLEVLAKYKLGSEAAEEVRWGKVKMNQQMILYFSMENEILIIT